ncbi:hypothetical protein PROFUN_15813 [Planoprotostelium fungivorum]|uniref:Uncharacterized protein n=1 Tax=Planoprotostelium fungivorum TaxID=1890364 RepID=A0A2P6MU52_9EUKA|nr:hypothetical protein PROFUN_15813 [Planoprotostelium fungivorum]
MANAVRIRSVLNTLISVFTSNSGRKQIASLLILPSVNLQCSHRSYIQISPNWSRAFRSTSTRHRFARENGGSNPCRTNWDNNLIEKIPRQIGDIGAEGISVVVPSMTEYYGSVVPTFDITDKLENSEKTQDIDRWTDEHIDRWTDEHIDRWTDEHIDRLFHNCCIAFARIRFESYFKNKSLQLLHKDSHNVPLCLRMSNPASSAPHLTLQLQRCVLGEHDKTYLVQFGPF